MSTSQASKPPRRRSRQATREEEAKRKEEEMLQEEEEEARRQEEAEQCLKEEDQRQAKLREHDPYERIKEFLPYATAYRHVMQIGQPEENKAVTLKWLDDFEEAVAQFENGRAETPQFPRIQFRDRLGLNKVSHKPPPIMIRFMGLWKRHNQEIKRRQRAKKRAKERKARKAEDDEATGPPSKDEDEA